MNQATIGYLIRSLFVVLTTLACGIAVSQYVGLSIRQSVLLSLPIGLFAASSMTLLYLAIEGRRGNPTRQLVILLAIEFVLVPVASAAAIAAYFHDRAPPVMIQDNPSLEPS